ncbi:polysaccharide pyruvyl transferase family protein [Jeotgalibaca caeni]|uniref:polysaccharide pyruvyl transferase family protein n=1 Tax=Jeotgalibaca caeni TaxID=3028623 RepID=UPI00237D68B6|nr:polysaccharide pyruvyl transferase family protein [Jeotgalibaca caeni]MDE1549880.1 polysaccharide pyruvyl transferase family protein [Jeotgalibaca caeni]
MKKLKVTYPVIPNMGDLLNPLIIEKLFDYKVESTNRYSSDLIGIGSGLGGFQKEPGLKNSFLQNYSKIFSGNLHVWGTGFIHSDETMTSSFFRKNVIIHALRGEKTRRRVEQIMNKDIDVPLGDGGLLASELINPTNKKYRLGIIPHFKEQEDPVFEKLKKKHSDSTIIDLREDPIEVIKKLSECETIISSSLHGLIVADSFGIPNAYVKVTDNLLGDGFKFHDYYSSFGLKCNVMSKTDILELSVTDIQRNYEVDFSEVTQKKQQLKEAFPKKI